MKIASKLVFISIYLVLPCSLIAQDSATFVDTDRSAITLLTEELQPDYLIFVDAVVAGKERRLFFDTGANRNVFHTRLEPDLGEPMGSSNGKVASGAAHTFSRFQPVEVKIRGHHLNGGRFCVTTSLDHLERYTGEPIDGVLGIQSVKDRKLILEFSKSRVIVSDANDSSFFDGLRVTSLSRNRQGLLFFRKGKAGNQDLGPILIDTGSLGYVSLEGSLFDELAKAGEIQHPRASPAIDGKGQFASQSGILSNFQLGGHTFKMMRVSRNGRSKVGIGLLSMFDVYLDFGSAKIALKPNERFGNPIQKGGIGIGIEKVSDNVVVGTVLADSPAEKEAVELGSIIISIDGTDVRNMELFKIRRMMLRKAGDTLDLIVEKNGKRFTKSLVQLGQRNKQYPASTRSQTR